MVDVVKLRIQAGKGGDGRISFLRTRRQPKGGPDGGDGGTGASVIFQANRNMHTLRDFAGKKEILGRDGQPGGADKRHGADPEDVIVEVPVGTSIWRITGTAQKSRGKRMYWFDDDGVRHERSSQRRSLQPSLQRQEKVIHLYTPEGITQVAPESEHTQARVIRIGNQSYAVEWVGEVVTHEQTCVVAKGGRGGRGNWQFRSSTHTTPKEAETGDDGEGGEYILELQLLADIGLIGFPNVGKSTLLSVLTEARPQIANYPFTTLEPNLGVLEFPPEIAKERSSILLADIPGIIPGASAGKGLGTAFLRHIERCRGLVFVLSLEDAALLDETATPADLAAALGQQYRLLEEELALYTQSLAQEGRRHVGTPMDQKKRIIALNKADIIEHSVQQALIASFKEQEIPVVCISAMTREGISALLQELAKITIFS